MIGPNNKYSVDNMSSSSLNNFNVCFSIIDLKFLNKSATGLQRLLEDYTSIFKDNYFNLLSDPASPV